MSEIVGVLARGTEEQMRIATCQHMTWAWALPYAPDGSDISWICEGCGLEATQAEFDVMHKPPGFAEQLTLFGRGRDDGQDP